VVDFQAIADFPTSENAYATQSVTTNGTGFFTFRLKAGFGVPSSIVLWAFNDGIPISTAQIRYTTNYADPFSENANANGETALPGTPILSGGKIFFSINLLPLVFTGIGDGNFGGVIVSHQAIGGNAAYLGFEITYAGGGGGGGGPIDVLFSLSIDKLPPGP